MISGAVCPRLSATSNLSRLLNLLDRHTRFRSLAYSPRWDVMEDDEALYLVRIMTGSLPTTKYDKELADYIPPGIVIIYVHVF